MKQYEAVLQTLERLGGIATLGQLNQEVFKTEGCQWKTKTPFASIRRIVQTNPEIYRIRPGLYALVSRRKELEQNGFVAETEKDKDSKETAEFDHTYYQGLLLAVGRLKGFGTFVPNQDRNRRFIDTTLGEMRTYTVIPHFSYDELVERSSTVDVIWFNERRMPHTFFEVEHSTDIQNSLLKFNDLRDFYARMVIVADGRRREEYSKKIHYSSFYELVKNRRVAFMDYESLNRQYEHELERQKFDFVL